jgi:hypothetical protein
VVHTEITGLHAARLNNRADLYSTVDLFSIEPQLICRQCAQLTLFLRIVIALRRPPINQIIDA